jgi:hypothetical protein
VAAWDRLGVRGQVITLKHRDDRAAHVAEAATAAGLPYDLFRVERHPNGGSQGCFESHVALARRASASGAPYHLVFEDDFEPTAELLTSEAAASALEEAVAFATTSTDWDIIFLGVVPNVWSARSQRAGKHLYRTQPWACTHAYIMSAAYAREVGSWRFRVDGKDAIDWRYRDCPRAFAFHPQAFKQYESPSDIRNVQLPVPAFLRDTPINMLSWYALNVGISLLQALAIIGVASMMLALGRSSSTKNARFARRLLARTAKAGGAV